VNRSLIAKSQCCGYFDGLCIATSCVSSRRFLFSNSGVRRIFDWRGPTCGPVKDNILPKTEMTHFSHYHLRCVTFVVTKRTNKTCTVVNHLVKCFPAIGVWPLGGRGLLPPP